MLFASRLQGLTLVKHKYIKIMLDKIREHNAT